MANNVAKLEGENYWVCVQSSTNTVFLPLFRFELAAFMFAEFYQDRWRAVEVYQDNYQEELSIDLMLFLQAKFGGTPERHPEYDNYVIGWKQKRSSELRQNSAKLFSEFLDWRRKEGSVTNLADRVFGPLTSQSICRANPPHGAEHIEEKEIDNIQKNCGKLDDEELYYCTMCAQFDFVIGERK